MIRTCGKNIRRKNWEKGSVGKPRNRWLDDAENDVKKMGVKRLEKNSWKLILKEARVLHGQLSQCTEKTLVTFCVTDLAELFKQKLLSGQEWYMSQSWPTEEERIFENFEKLVRCVKEWSIRTSWCVADRWIKGSGTRTQTYPCVSLFWWGIRG